MKVLMGLDVYLPDVDGVITCLHNYCLVLKDKVDVEVGVPSYGRKHIDDLPYKVKRSKSRYLPILNMRYARPHADRKFKKYLLQNDYDIIHVHSPFAMGKTLLKIARKKNIPIIATFHTNFRPIFHAVVPIKPIVEFAVRRVGKFYNKLDEVLVVGDTVEQQARSFGITNTISHMPFGTNTERPSDDELMELKNQANQRFNIASNETVFLFVGRVSVLKRVDMILDALKILRDRGQEFRFFVVGKGHHEKKLQRRAKRLGLCDCVTFTGFIEAEEKNMLYARADLFLFPSLYDNFGLVKVEAACFETPSVLIRGSATAQGITDDVNGFLSDDNAGDFATRIEQAITNREELGVVSKNAARDVYFHWRECADRLVEKYTEVIAKHKREVAG